MPHRLSSRGHAASGRSRHRRRVRQIGQLGLLCPPAPFWPHLAAIYGGRGERPDDRRHRRPRSRGVSRVLWRIRRPRPRQCPRRGRAIVTGAITYTGTAELQRDIANLKAGLAKVKGVSGFLPVVAPASALPNAKDEHYRDEEAFLFGLAEALATEYRAIIDAGLDLQVDDAFIPYQYEKMVPPMTLADYRNWASLHIDALNHALRGLPKDRTRYHICWGSWNGPHMFDVPIKDIVDLVLRV